MPGRRRTFAPLRGAYSLSRRGGRSRDSLPPAVFTGAARSYRPWTNQLRFSITPLFVLLVQRVILYGPFFLSEVRFDIVFVYPLFNHLLIDRILAFFFLQHRLKPVVVLVPEMLFCKQFRVLN